MTAPTSATTLETTAGSTTVRDSTGILTHVAVKLRNVEGIEFGPIIWSVFVVSIASAALLGVALLEYLIALPEIVKGVAIDQVHVWWPMTFTTIAIAVGAFLISVPIYFGAVQHKVDNHYRTAATQTAHEEFADAFPWALLSVRPSRGRNAWIPATNRPSGWEWDYPIGDVIARRVELDLDHGLIRVSSGAIGTGTEKSVEWTDLGGEELWWDTPPPFSPHLRRATDASVDTPPAAASWAGRATISVLTVVATATLYFSEASWSLFFFFVLLVPLVVWLYRFRASARMASEQIWRVAVASALTRYCTVSDLDALQLTAGRMRLGKHRVTIRSQIMSGPATGRWEVWVTRWQPQVLMVRRVSRGRFRTTLLPLPWEPEAN